MTQIEPRRLRVQPAVKPDVTFENQVAWAHYHLQANKRVMPLWNKHIDHGTVR